MRAHSVPPFPRRRCAPRPEPQIESHAALLQTEPDSSRSSARASTTSQSTASHPQAQVRRLHRRQRLGQVQPGVRHALRRRPAPLRREPERVRAPVPRASSSARRSSTCAASRRPSPSSRRARRATRARRSAPSPRSTTTCACSTRASGGSTATLCGKRGQRAARRRRSSTSADRRAEGPARCSLLAPLVAHARASSASCSTSCASAASCACASTASMHRLDELPALDKKRKHDIELVVDRVTRQRSDDRSVWPKRSSSRCAKARAS